MLLRFPRLTNRTRRHGTAATGSPSAGIAAILRLAEARAVVAFAIVVASGADPRTIADTTNNTARACRVAGGAQRRDLAAHALMKLEPTPVRHLARLPGVIAMIPCWGPESLRVPPFTVLTSRVLKRAVPMLATNDLDAMVEDLLEELTGRLGNADCEAEPEEGDNERTALSKRICIDWSVPRKSIDRRHPTRQSNGTAKPVAMMARPALKSVRIPSFIALTPHVLTRAMQKLTTGDIEAVIDAIIEELNCRLGEVDCEADPEEDGDDSERDWTASSEMQANFQ